MTPIPPVPQVGAVTVVFAKDQKEYDPLPAICFPNDPFGVVITEWEFSAEDLARVLAGGRLRLSMWTFRKALQPVRVEIVE